MTIPARQRHIIVIFIVLNTFWLLMSGKWDLFHIAIGLVASGIVTWATIPILTVYGNQSGKTYYMFDLPWFKLTRYWIWLLGQIVVANFQVAKIVLDPRLPIKPQVVRIKRKFDNPVAQTTLANSIIITPGTLTIDVIDGEYTVHTLTYESAVNLQSSGDNCVFTRVGKVFSDNNGE